MNQNSKSALDSSFNPFDIHFFTNGSGLAPCSALPPQYPAPLPSSHVRNYHPESISPELYPLSDTSSIASADSNPSSRTPTPLHSPKPRAPSLASPPPRIFVPFRKDAATPELVLKKKLPARSNMVSRPK